MGTSSICGPSSCHESTTRLFLLFTHILKCEWYTVNTFSLLLFINANWDGKKHQWLDTPFCLIQHFQTISMFGVQVILHSIAMNKNENMNYLNLETGYFFCRIIITKLWWHCGRANGSSRGKDERLVDWSEGVGSGSEPVTWGSGAGRGRGWGQDWHLAARRQEATIRHANATFFITQNGEHVTCTELTCCNTQW